MHDMVVAVSLLFFLFRSSACMDAPRLKTEARAGLHYIDCVRRKRFRLMAFIEHNFVIEANEHNRIWLSCIDRHCHNSERPGRARVREEERSQRTIYDERRHRIFCRLLSFSSVFIFHFERR